MKITINHLKKFIDLDTVFSAAITVFFLVIFITTLTMEEMTTYLLPRLLGTLGIIIGLAALIVKFHKISEKGGKGEVKDKKQKPKGINVLYTILIYPGLFLSDAPSGIYINNCYRNSGLFIPHEIEEKSGSYYCSSSASHCSPSFIRLSIESQLTARDS